MNIVQEFFRVETLLGPYGATALSLLGLFGLAGFCHSLTTRLEKVTERMVSVYKEQTEIYKQETIECNKRYADLSKRLWEMQSVVNSLLTKKKLEHVR